MMDLPRLQKNVLLAPYTTYNIGGNADYFIAVTTKEELINAVMEARKNTIPYFILGTGANILFGDKGFRGLVIKNEAKNIVFNNNTVTVDGGVVLENLIKECLEKNLSGFEHYAGIPSTVGGALWQNLHFLSPDREETVFIESVLESAEILDENNVLQTVAKDFFKFGYDYSILHERNLLVTEATFLLLTKEKALIQKQMDENLRWRNEKQPQLKEFPSCGSVFKKKEGIGAGRLIEEVGLKGYMIGGAQVSQKHANYIVNIGNAKAKDVIELIHVIQDTVRTKLGYALEPEISFIGEF